jgi:sRNA-binding protein
MAKRDKRKTTPKRKTTATARPRAARPSKTDMAREFAARNVSHLSTLEVGRRVAVRSADLAITEDRIDDLSAQLVAARAHRALLAAEIDGMQSVILSR